MNPHHHLVRTACHVHSTWSYDGKWPLQDLAKSFSRRGYRAVLITEHDQGFSESKRLDHRAACQKASDADILLVPGIEYSDPANVIHLLVWGDVPFYRLWIHTRTSTGGGAGERRRRCAGPSQPQRGMETI